MFSLHTQKLNSVDQTGREMLRLAMDYNEDLRAFDNYTLPQFYNMVKSLKYKPDPKNIEFLSRPGASIKKSAMYRDCDEKATIMLSWLWRQGKLGRLKIPARLIGVSRINSANPPLHHVLLEAIIRGESQFIDATYPGNNLFDKPKYTKIQPITPWIQYGTTGNF